MAGWGDAWGGLSQQAFGFAIDSLRGKQQQKYQMEREAAAQKAAEAQEKARRDWEAKMVRMRAEIDRSARKEDQSFRSLESGKARKFEAEQAAAQRGLTQGYYNQMAASDRERLALQREEMAQRERMAGMGLAGRGGGGGSERSAVSDSILNNIRTEFRELAPQEAYQMAVQKYGREIADAAFGGVSGSRDQAAGIMGSLSRNVARYFQD